MLDLESDNLEGFLGVRSGLACDVGLILATVADELETYNTLGWEAFLPRDAVILDQLNATAQNPATVGHQRPAK